MFLRFLKSYLNLLLPLFLLLFGIYSSVIIYQSTAGKIYSPHNHLILLSEQFIKHNLYLSPLGLPNEDIVDYFGKQYLYFGPLPSILLIPFVLVFGRNFSQIILGITSLIVSFLAIYIISRKFKFRFEEALWLAIFFVFSTVLFSVGILNFSSYQVQALGVLFVLLSLAEYFGKKRYFIIGVLLAFAGMTRITLYLSVIFFLIEIFRKGLRLKNLLYLLLPISASLILLGVYNYKRFHSFFESGYQYQTTVNIYPMSVHVKRGYFSIVHVPANLYSFLIKAPNPVLEGGGGFILKFPYLKADPWGMAIWFTSPLFIYLLTKPKKNEYTVSSLITASALLSPSLFYFGIGFVQFGYRYSLDFLPFLFILLLPSLKPNLSLGVKTLIIIGVLFNCLYLTSLWDIYPLFNIYNPIK